ncbi:MAG: transcriptional repressor NrdR [Oscillospiraceae bacterium]|nr:transcriptional repressor NrdR [Oscillospiraceae bacterium]
MKCPSCGFEETKVIDSRPMENKIRRRRGCAECGHRFTTFETAETPLLMVLKKDGSVEPFERNKVVRGVFTAIKKRPVNAHQVENIADEIENSCANKMVSQISTVEIGDIILEHLKKIDDVAYIRFASVYKDFADIDEFVNAISELDGSRRFCTSSCCEKNKI